MLIGLCAQNIEAMDAASQEWQQLPSLLASLLSYPHVRADPLGAQCISAVCDLMAYTQTAAAVAATDDDDTAQSSSAQRKHTYKHDQLNMMCSLQKACTSLCAHAKSCIHPSTVLQ
jgi:hypothetical protein